MSDTYRLVLPMLAPGQAQKELTHNEALLRLDALVQATCLAGPGVAPPQELIEGATYLCGPAPTGAWSGHSGALATWTASGWRFAAPFEGCKVMELPSGLEWQYLGGAWSRGTLHATEVKVEGEVVLRGRQPAIASPSGGSITDTEARITIGAILRTLREHGLIRV